MWVWVAGLDSGIPAGTAPIAGHRGAALIFAVAALTAPAPTAAQSPTRSERSRSATARSMRTSAGRALAAARGPSEAEIRRRTGRPADAPLRIEVLAVERQRLAKDALPETFRRRAEVTLYDYDSDRRSVATVDLESGQVESVFVVRRGQPPFTDAEVARAFELVLADPESAARLRANFARVASRPLLDPGELEVTGFVYHAESMPDRNRAETALCGRHRCAQLLVRTADDVALELPIVDLSRERVLETRWFGPTPPPAAPAPAAPLPGMRRRRRRLRRPWRRRSGEEGPACDALSADASRRSRARVRCSPRQPPLPPLCPGGTTAIDQTLTTGSRWELCVEQRTRRGHRAARRVLHAAGQHAASVLKEASVAQIYVVYDDDSARRLLVSNPGLGGSSLVALAAEDCPSGTLLLSNALCMTQAGRGYAWKDDGDKTNRGTGSSCSRSRAPTR